MTEKSYYKQSELPRDLYIKYEWIRVDEIGDAEPAYIRGAERTEAEKEKAAQEYDANFIH